MGLGATELVREKQAGYAVAGRQEYYTANPWALANTWGTSSILKIHHSFLGTIGSSGFISIQRSGEDDAGIPDPDIVYNIQGTCVK